MINNNAYSEETVPLELKPAEVPEWEEEDFSAAVLAEDLRFANVSEASEMLDELSFRLPADIASQELVEFAKQKKTPLDVSIIADTSRFAFYLVMIPLNIVVPPHQRLVRLRLILNMRSDQANQPLVAWDMFPTDRVEQLDVKVGEFSLDISKALGFIFSAPASSISELLGLKLQFPLGWKSTTAVIDASGPMSNPAEWYINDASITSSFIGYAIIRAPRGVPVTVTADLLGEVRRSHPLGWLLKARFQAMRRTYTINRTGG